MEQSAKKVIMYAHGSAYNHGCEAIVRSTMKSLSLKKENTILYSNRIDGDLAFNIDNIVSLCPINETPVERNSMLGYLYRLRSHLYDDHEKMYFRYFGKKQYKYLYKEGDVALSIGGDNYCYESALTGLEVRNYWLKKMGFKTILWGASLTEEFLTPRILEDLNRYSLIVVRENLSYELLKKHNIKTEIVCGPDPAFQLETTETLWPDGKKHDNVIGINISCFVTDCAPTDLIGIKNYVNLINWILEETDCEIALIPHVVFPDGSNNDILNAKKLMEFLPKNDRIFSVEKSYNCCQIKSLISKCRFFIGARTHSTIAAYSTYVPTLVVGYSNKSIGIARDLFGTEKDYVCSVQNMTDENMLRNSFVKQFSMENTIRAHLKKTIPGYKESFGKCIDAVTSFL